MTSPSVQSLLSQHQYPAIPSSPARSFASTAYPAASLSIPPPPPPIPSHFLSSNDVKASISAYETLSEAAKAFRKSLSQVAGAAAAFGAALETCARCKGAGDTGDGLMGGSGLQYLIASNMHLLSDAIYRGFEVPILHELDSYKEKTAENEALYKKEANEKSKELRKREAQHLKLARQKRRNLTSFREALLDLTSKIDDLENLKYSHYRTSLTHSQETSQRILDYSAIVVRAEIEIFEKIASKGWDASGGLDDLIARAADPFAAPISNSGEGEIFSILPTESILPNPNQGVVSRSGSISGGGGGGGGGGAGSTLLEGKYRSLAGTITHDEDGDDGDDHSEDEAEAEADDDDIDGVGVGVGGGDGVGVDVGDGYHNNNALADTNYDTETDTSNRHKAPSLFSGKPSNHS
ncbi:hypothetical protein BZA77DRAFT_309513 [Pyronema omphalodes]|nr:hypothetical protein BZA77DRAFT_309513 [Pyronema omphalodes]